MATTADKDKDKDKDKDIISFGNTPQAKNDLFTNTGLTEDSLGSVILDVMGNDSGGKEKDSDGKEKDIGGKAKALWSLDDGFSAGGIRPTDLLAQDTARTEASSTDRSANGATIWITPDGKVGYDAATLSGAFKAQLQSLGTGGYLTDSFTYAIRLGNGTLSWAAATVRILGTNDAAVLSAGVANLTETDAVLSTGGTLTITDVDSAASFVAQTDTLGTYGTFVINTAGVWSYTTSSAHNEFVAGTTYTDSFSVFSADGTATSVTVNILGTNDAATGTATATLADGSENTAYIVSVSALLAGFSDAEGDTLSVSGLSADNGAVVDNLDGTFTITPTLNFYGLVNLSYTVIDGHGGSTAAAQSYTLAGPYIVSGATATILAVGALDITAATDLGGVNTLIYNNNGNAVTMTAAQFKAFTTFTGGAGTDGIILSTAIDDGAGGTYNASTKTFTSIEELTFATGINQITLTVAQHAGFTTITAPGSDTITISGDGAVTTRTSIETYVLGDDTTNAREVTTSSTALNLVANNAGDTVTVNAAALAQNTALTIAAASASALTVTGLVGNVVATNLSGVLTVTTANAADNTISITTGTAALNLIANNAGDTVTVNAAALAENTALTMTAASASALTVTGLVGDVVATNLSGALTVTTANAVDDGISITTGTAATSVNVAAGAATDTVSINATALANNIALTITSDGAAAGTVNVTGLAGDLVVSNPTSGTIAVAVVDNMVDDGIAITAGASNLAITGVADGDTVTVTGFTGSTLTGTIAGTTGKFNITAGTGTSAITTAAGDDTFTFVAVTGLTSADTVDGGTGTDTVALTGNTAFAAADYFDNVTNIEAITLANTNTAVTITTQDTLVAAGATLTLSNAANSGVLTFNGAAELDGAFNITGGSGNDNITGGTGDDTFTFVAATGLTSGDTVDGGTGTDTVALTGNTAFTAANDFDKVANIEAITLANTNTAITITTQDALVAAGATLTLSNAANSGALTFNGAAETNGKFSITAGSGDDSITGGAGADTFTFDAATGLTSMDTVDGGTGTDTVALTGNTAFTAANDFDNVNNIEVITLANTNTAVTITTQDALVAAGATLTLSNAANSGALTFDGAAETNGAFNITGGSGDDNITGGTGDDTFTFVAATGLTSTDMVDGGAGTDTVALTGNTDFTAANDFDNVTNIEAITLANTNTLVLIFTLDTLVAAGATLTLSNAANSGELIFDGAAETDGAFNITGGSGDDSITGGAGTDQITGGLGADTIKIGSVNDNIRQTVIYSSTTDGAAAGANSGSDRITQFDANANNTTDDLIQITGILKTVVDDDADGVLDYSTTNGIDGGNQAIVGGANQEATVLVDAEVELVLANFTTAGLANVLVELGEEINFTGIATGQEHLFSINFSTTQTALVLYTAGAGGDDIIVATDIQVLGIVTHNDGTGLVAGNMTF